MAGFSRGSDSRVRLIEPDAIAAFLARLRYVGLDASRPEAFTALSGVLGPVAEQGLAIFLSTAPSRFEPTIAGLASVDLTPFIDKYEGEMLPKFLGK